MIYRKWGRVVRWEDGHLVRVEEAGEAREEGGRFEVRPLGASIELPEIGDGVVDVAKRIEGPIERLIVSEGVAEHECDGVRWREETKRIHVAYVLGKERVLFDLADFAWSAGVPPAPREAGGTPALRLAPNVAAALLPSLEGTKQTPGGRDGYGKLIAEEGTFYYRPSYRTRPVPMRFNLRFDPIGTIDLTLPRAIAILESGGFLCEDGTIVRGRVKDVLAVGSDTRLYPYAAGCLGAEMVVSVESLGHGE